MPTPQTMAEAVTGSDRKRKRGISHPPDAEATTIQNPPRPHDTGPRQRPRLENAHDSRRRETEDRRSRESPTDNDPNATFQILTEFPFYPSSSESESEAEPGENGDVDTWINARVGSGEAEVLEALRCTSMNPNLADRVLRDFVAGKGIPRDTPGIWTAEDDESIEGEDARQIERLLNKHGQEYFNARWEYLSIMRASHLGMRTEINS